MRYAEPKPWKHLYGYKWQKARTEYLRKNPLCVECLSRGVTSRSEVVDHKIPHRGDEALFWDRNNWQALCQHCHDSHKQRLEKSGRVMGCDEDGNPIDANHHWNK